MNRIYRLVWSRVTNTWVAVSENAKRRGKSGRRAVLRRKAIVAAFSLGCAPFAHAGQSVAAKQPEISARITRPCVPPGCAVTAVGGTMQPTGGQVVSGTGSITQSGNTTTIRQSSQDLVLNWQSFNIGSQDTVDFLQPSAAAIAVNRILGTNGSQILGHLDANGQVWLINPNGVLFGQGAQVNVGGLVASVLGVSDLSLSSNTIGFSGNGTGSIVNQGTINAANGGYVALLGNRVSNQGTISARLGTVALGAGSATTLTFSGNSLVKMQVDQSTLNTMAKNGGLIQADGGTVIMSAGAKNALLASVVNNTGVIEARTVENHNGTISLLGGMAAGTVNVGGTLDASAPNGGNGGAIETSATHVEVANDAKVTTLAATGKTGTWLIDPTDFTVAPSGGDISGATLSGDLNSTSFIILSSNGTSAVTGGGSGGNINVNDTVSWSANTALTLTASNNVNVNANMTATGNTAGLVINPNTANGSQAASGSGAFNLNMGNSITLSGTNPSLSIAGNAYTVINTLGAAGSTTGTDLQGINSDLSGYYALGSNIDATATSSWNSGAGFTPIGNLTTNFAGSFNGLGHTISNLTINQPSISYVGLFGFAGTGSVIQNVGLVAGSVSGYSSVGGLVGLNWGVVTNTYATGSVSAGSGSGAVGGLVGANNGGTVSNSYATGSVSGGSGSSEIGGLVGGSSGPVSNSYATGSVSAGGGSNSVGGLVGANNGGTVNNSYATGSVSVSGGSGSFEIGGLVGLNLNSSVTNSYATGSVNVSGGSGSSDIGGLVGFNEGTVNSSYAMGSVSGGSGCSDIGGLVGENYGSTVSNSYATGSVSGSVYVGGLVGENHGSGSVSNSYATGSLSGTARVGGLVGENDGSITNGYAAGDVSSGINSQDIGGLVGINSGTVSNSYATGNVSGASGSNQLGGLVGANFGTISNGFAAGSVSGSSYVGGLVGFQAGSVSGAALTTAQMQTASNFTGFNFTTAPSASGNNWVIVDTDGTLNNAGGAAGATFPMLASEYSTTINNAHQLQLVAMNTSASYTLGQNINASATGNGGDVWGSTGFAPIGNGTAPFTGTFDGLGYTISNLSMNLPLVNYEGLFGDAGSTALIRNVGLIGESIMGGDRSVGGLVGLNDGTVSNSYTTGNVTGDGGSGYVGGLVGYNRGSGTVSNSFTTDSVTGYYWVGGLVGLNYGAITTSYATGNTTGLAGRAIGGLVGSNSGTLSNSYATGSVSGGSYYDGGLVGDNSHGTISNSYATGSVSGASGVGGLVGWGDVGTIDSSYATGNVSGHQSVGGLLGLNDGTVSNSYYAIGTVTGDGGSEYVGALVGYNRGSGTVNSSYATGGVTGYYWVGGLVGLNYGAVSNSYATGTVKGLGGQNVGGLIGSNSGTLSNSYVTGSVSGGSYNDGGLVGDNANGSISNSYATGSVSGFNNVGGLVGHNNGGTVSNSYATGNVSGSSNVGGLVGLELNGGTVGNSFWDVTTSGQSTSAGGTGLTTAQMQTASSFTGWSIATTGGSGDVWRIYEGNTFPLLISFLKPLTLTDAPDATVTYNGTTQSGASTAISGVLGAAATGTNAGFYNGYYSTQQGYDITGGNLTITPATATLSGTRVYDGTTIVAGNILTATGVDGQTFSVTGAGDPSNLASKNVQTDSTLATLTGLTLGGSSNGGLSSNYSPLSTTGSSITINPLALTGVSIASASSTYGAAVTPGAVSFSNLIAGDVVSSTASIVSLPSNYSTSHNLNAGSYAQTASSTLSGASAGNYTFAGYTTPTNNYMVGQLALSGTTIAAVNTIYGTNAAAGAVSFGNVISGDLVSATASIVTPGNSTSTSGHLKVNVSNYAQTASPINGADSGDYSFSGYTTPTNNYTVSPLALPVTGLTASNKVYNGSTTAVLGGTASIAPISGDIVLLSGTRSGAFADPNVATAKPVTVSGYTLTGLDKGDYLLTEPTGLTANITRLGSVAWVGGATGNWSTATNWAGGAIPDYANVAAVTIPSGATVTYDSGVPGATTLTTLTNSGNLLMAAGTLGTTGNLTTNGFQQSGGMLNVGGKLTVQSPSGGVTLGNIVAGSLSIGSQAGDITQLASTAVNVSGATSLTADNGVTGSGDVKYNITLANGGNSFAGAVASNGLNISLANSNSAGLILGTTTAGTTTAPGALTANSGGGPITEQTASTIVNVTGTSNLSAGGNITLANASNIFGGAISSSGSNISLLGSGAGGLLLGNTYASGNLTATASGGALTQTGSTAVTAYGTSTLTASGANGNITLANGNDLVGAVTATGVNVSLTDSSSTGLILGNTTATGTLTAATGLYYSGYGYYNAAPITQATSSSWVKVTRSTSLTAQGQYYNCYYGGCYGPYTAYGNITLANPANIFGDAVSSSGSNISLLGSGAGGLLLGNTYASGNLAATASGGALTQTGSTAVTAYGTSTLTARGANGNITLANGNDLVGAVTATGVNVSLTDSSSTGLILGNTTATGYFTAASNNYNGAPITQDPSSAVKVKGVTTLSAVGGTFYCGVFCSYTVYGDIVLPNTTNTFGDAVTSTGANVSLADGNATGLLLGNTTAHGTFTATTSAGAIAQGLGTSVTVYNTWGGGTTLTADNGVAGTGDVKYSITLANAGNNYGGAITSNGLNISLTESNSGGLLLGNTTAGTSAKPGTLTATSQDGGIAQATSTAVNVTGTSSLTASGANITLANAGNSFGGAVTSTGLNISLANSNSVGLILGTTTAGTTTTPGTFTADATGGAITQAPNTAALKVYGASTLIADNGVSGTGDVEYNITLANAGNIFAGPVASTGLNISLKDSNSAGLILGNTTAGNMTTTGTLTATSTSGGPITQAVSTAVNVTGTSTLTASAANITLANVGNSFGGAVTSTGLNISLADSNSAGLILGTTTAGTTTAPGTFTADATGGAITQAPNTAALKVYGASTLIADNGVSGAGDVKYNITLANATNNFVGAVTTNGLNIDLVDGTGGLILGNATAGTTTTTGTFTADSTGGAITQAASTAVNVTGVSSLTSSGIMTLANATNNFGGAVTASGSAVTLNDAAALTAIVNSTGATSLTSVGAMNVSGTVGTTLTTKTTNAATTFGATTVGTSLSATSGTGAVTETSAGILKVAGGVTDSAPGNSHVTVNGVKSALILP